MRPSVNCLLVVVASLGFLPSSTLAGNNSGGRARLGWSSGPFEPSGIDLSKSPWNDDLRTLPQSAGPTVFPLYVLLDGVRDIQEMAVALRWSPADSIGCYSIVPVRRDSACGWVNEVPPGGDFQGDSAFGWSIHFPSISPPANCLTYSVSAISCGNTMPADFRLVSVRVKDSLGAVDSLSIVGNATIMGGTGVVDAAVLVESALPQTIVAGRSVTLAVHGTGFASQASVELRNSGGAVRATQVTVKTSELLWAVFLPPASMAGPADLVVRLPDASSDFLAGAVQLVQPADPQTAICYQDRPAEVVKPRPRVAWADFNKDGNPDFAYFGGPCAACTSLLKDSHVFLWVGTGQPWVAVPDQFDDADWGSVCVGDYDNDGDVDILTTGNKAGVPKTTIYRLDGQSFTKLSPGLPGVAFGTAQWGDYDNDGRPDILLLGRADTTGNGDIGPITRIYHNTTTGYVDIHAGLPGLFFGDAAWADYDNDGDLDLLITGNNGTSSSPIPTALVYRNDGGVFTPITAGLTGVWKSAVAWVDRNSDGWLDIVYIGATGTDAPTGAAPVARYYVNNAAGGFTNTATGITPVYDGSITFGDYQPDGFADAVVTGVTGGTASYAVARLYNGVTTSLGSLPGFAGVDAGGNEAGCFEGNASWWHDGELLVGGYSTNITTVGPEYERLIDYDPTAQCGGANQAPQAPTGLSATLVGDKLSMSWSAATDYPTPSPGLSYNLRVGTTPGGMDILSPAALASGYRLVPQLGNAQKRTSWTLKVPLAQTYYWTVQAIDTGWLGGAFAAEQHTSGVLGVDGSDVSGLYFGLLGPNPIAGRAEFELRLPRDGQVKATICDVSGRDVATLADGHFARGTHRFAWEGKLRGTTGVYFAVCRVDGRSLVRRVLVIR